MGESAGAEGPGGSSVVDQIRHAYQPGASQQRETSAENLRLQRLGRGSALGPRLGAAGRLGERCFNHGALDGIAHWRRQIQNSDKCTTGSTVVVLPGPP